MSRKSATAIISVCGVLLVISAFEVDRYITSVPRPLGAAPRIEIHPTELSKADRQQFLEGDFKVVRDVRELPASILQIFTEQGGSRLLIANPSEKFDAGDVIYPNVPRTRLIIAGVTDAKCFVHYAQGGRGLSFVVEFFSLSSNQNMEPVWKGSCAAPAANFQDLRLCVSKAF